MLDAATVGFLEGGCALIVGSVAPDGEPNATRGWGLTIVEDDPIVGRLLLPDDDERAHACLLQGAPIAVTAADVPSLRSLQLKGRSLGVEPATEDDVARAERYTAAYFADIIRADGLPASTLEGFRPFGYVACTVVVEELYDQTPGPGAGAPWTGVTG